MAAEGYDLEVDSAFLLVHHVPYVTAARIVKLGTIVTALTLAGPNRTAQPPDHTVHFYGELPCDAEGTALIAIINSSGNQQLTPTIAVNHFFSSKPVGGVYPDYYEKIRTYVEILGAQARQIDPAATARPHRAPQRQPDDTADSVFLIPDTNSARANIALLNAKFAGHKIGIIGLGGTGSYVLDLVAKTPVSEIHLFDGDEFQVHNAFRAPGAPDGDSLNRPQKLLKVAYFAAIYGRMHRGIRSHAVFLTAQNADLLNGLSFAFVCVDSAGVRSFVINRLLALGIPFIDVGLGVNIVDECLIGSLRVTAGSEGKKDHLPARIGQEELEGNEYAPNIQIADLNCLNAALAVIRWKKMLGFYQDLKHEHNSLYFVNTGKLINDDTAA